MMHCWPYNDNSLGESKRIVKPTLTHRRSVLKEVTMALERFVFIGHFWFKLEESNDTDIHWLSLDLQAVLLCTARSWVPKND